jgi:large subunit ribosomal protein L7/L12
MPKLDEQILTLQQKLQQLQLRQQRTDARKRAINGLRERKADTRRKILLGGLILEKLRQGQLDRSLIEAWLNQALTRAGDRALFGLPVTAPAVGDAATGDNPPTADPRASTNRPPGESELPPRLEGDDRHGVR